MQKTISQAIETLELPTTASKAATAPPLLARSLLAEFQTRGNPQREAMVDEALAFCADMQARKTPRWLSLLGPSGNGKTFLVRLIFKWVQQQGCLFKRRYAGGDVVQAHRTMWVSWRMACKAMKNGDFTASEELTINRMHRDHAVWCAVIDDIGAGDETSKGYLQNALETIVDARLGTWTIFTSNMNLDQIGEKLDRRISSRMLRAGNRVLEVDLPDWNLEEK